MWQQQAIFSLLHHQELTIWLAWTLLPINIQIKGRPKCYVLLRGICHINTYQDVPSFRAFINQSSPVLHWSLSRKVRLGVIHNVCLKRTKRALRLFMNILEVNFHFPNTCCLLFFFFLKLCVSSHFSSGHNKINFPLNFSKFSIYSILESEI